MSQPPTPPHPPPATTPPPRHRRLRPKGASFYWHRSAAAACNLACGCFMSPSRQHLSMEAGGSFSSHVRQDGSASLRRADGSGAPHSGVIFFFFFPGLGKKKKKKCCSVNALALQVFTFPPLFALLLINTIILYFLQ